MAKRPPKCAEIVENYQKLHFFQIFAHFYHFGNLMIPILLEMAKNTFCVPSYMEKVSFQLIYLIKLVTRPQKCAKIVENYLKLVLFVACVTNFMKYIKQKDTFTCNLRHWMYFWTFKVEWGSLNWPKWWKCAKIWKKCDF